eukprot:s811_g15.t1
MVEHSEMPKEHYAPTAGEVEMMGSNDVEEDDEEEMMEDDIPIPPPPSPPSPRNPYVFLLLGSHACQDARKNVLALRFTAASDKELIQHSGVLGVINMAEGQDFTAVGVKNASVKVIKDLCTGHSQVPFSDSGVTLLAMLCFF